MRVVAILSLLALSAHALVPTTRMDHSAPLGRRSVLHHSAAALAASFAAGVARPVSALEDLGDLSAPSSADEKMEPMSITMSVVTKDASSKKQKDTPFSRLKELQTKGNLTDKEKKELRRLKADEMCEMLGRGC